MSLSAMTSLFGGFMTAVVQLFQGDELKAGLQLVSFGDLIGFSVLVISITSLSRLFLTLTLSQKD
jgi:hypothetical protein